MIFPVLSGSELSPSLTRQSQRISALLIQTSDTGTTQNPSVRGPASMVGVSVSGIPVHPVRAASVGQCGLVRYPGDIYSDKKVLDHLYFFYIFYEYFYI